MLQFVPHCTGELELNSSTVGRGLAAWFPPIADIALLAARIFVAVMENRNDVEVRLRTVHQYPADAFQLLANGVPQLFVEAADVNPSALLIFGPVNRDHEVAIGYEFFTLWLVIILRRHVERPGFLLWQKSFKTIEIERLSCDRSGNFRGAGLDVAAVWSDDCDMRSARKAKNSIVILRMLNEQLSHGAIRHTHVLSAMDIRRLNSRSAP